jgi:hypothetical protein
LINSIHGSKLVWSPTSEGPGAVIYFYEEPPFLFLQNKLEYLMQNSEKQRVPQMNGILNLVLDPVLQYLYIVVLFKKIKPQFQFGSY